ncbi:MAG: molybdopterin-dependent oxidoreductase, partial [Anaerolineales bacterium]|nr:molybdopterin-dependent oxidoreductase [Anaerolineales bacterium]
GRFEPLYEERARVTQPIVRRNGVQVETSWDEALTLVAQKLKEGGAVGLTDAATSNEALGAFAKLFAGLGGAAGRLGPAATELGFGQPARIQDILEADLIVVAGADPLAQQRVIGYLINRAADQGAEVALIGVKNSLLSERAVLDVPNGGAAEVVERAAQASKPVVVYGAGLRPQVVRALKALSEQARFLALEPAANGRGAAAAGLNVLEPSKGRMLYLLLGERSDGAALAGQANGAFTVVQAAYRSPLVEQADVVLPTPIWAERSGHVTNLEGQVLPLTAAVPMPAGVRDEADVLAVLAKMV